MDRREKSLSTGIAVALKRLPLENDLVAVLSEPDQHKTVENPYKTLFDKNSFSAACRHQYPNISETEANSIYVTLKDGQKGNLYGHLGLFGIIYECAAAHLHEIGSDLFCKHEDMILWRDLVHVIGQQLFICAFMAERDITRNSHREVFDFPTNLKPDDFRLRQILAGGVAENHFHLAGSSHPFLCNWVCLMNHITHRKRDFDKISTQLNNNAPQGIRDKPLYDDVRRAAAIRVYFWRLLCYDNEDVDGEELPHFLLKHLFLGGQGIQEEIDRERFRFSDSLDYICNTATITSPYAGISGENRFLYEMFRALYSGNAVVIKYADYFYDYLAICCRFRSELIQDNNAVGFTNFKNYQDRKEFFIERYQKYYDSHIRMAFGIAKATLGARYVEARVSSLFEDAGKFDNYIQGLLKYAALKQETNFKHCDNYDKLLNRCKLVWDKDKCPNEKVKVFFILSIPKEPEKGKQAGKQANPLLIPYRHEKHIRNAVIPRINSLMALREKYPKTARYIFGIDACSTEIGCRPEVFAPAFRRVRAQSILQKDFPNKYEDMPMLHITFHAGEDFLDIVDGLRYIDEAVRFLDMRSADRFGHALALGVAPQDYYSTKRSIIILPRHDLLDNAVWMYTTLLRYNIQQHDVLTELAETYRKQYMYIYSGSKSENESVPMIEAFYDSWLLRGDNPEYYRQKDVVTDDKTFIKHMDYLSFYKSGFESDLCRGDEAEKIRGYNAKARELYHEYHYNPSVRERGGEVFEMHASPRYIHAVELLQKEMQREIAEQGIGIECNPSSNNLIGTFKDYAKHPIFNMNNDGLDDGADNPLMQVSINTDDQGVFDTDLENEYSLITNALLSKTDDDGNKKYKPYNVYKYIDNVRKMGIEQSFKRMEKMLLGEGRYEI